MRLFAAWVALMLGFAGVGFAGEADGAKKPLVPPANLSGYLSGYSVELQTDRPEQPIVQAPQGLSTLRDQETPTPFLGLTLKRSFGTK